MSLIELPLLVLPKQETLSLRRFRAFLIAGAIGPLALLFAWLVGGAVKAEYSWTQDSISGLSSMDATTRIPVTIAFIIFVVGKICFAHVLRSKFSGKCWIAAFISAFAMLGVAATPIGWSQFANDSHVGTATVAYLGLALTPLMAIPDLMRMRNKSLVTFSCIVVFVCTACIAANDISSVHGLVQRVGLTTSNLWTIVIATYLWRHGEAPLSTAIDPTDQLAAQNNFFALD